MRRPVATHAAQYQLLEQTANSLLWLSAFGKLPTTETISLFSYKGSKDTDCSGIAEPGSHLATPSLLQFLLGARTAHRGFNRAGVKVSPQMLQ